MMEEKRKRFEFLMKQGGVPAGLMEPYFLDGYIEQVEINRSNREWNITDCKGYVGSRSNLSHILPADPRENASYCQNFIWL